MFVSSYSDLILFRTVIPHWVLMIISVFFVDEVDWFDLLIQFPASVWLATVQAFTSFEREVDFVCIHINVRWCRIVLSMLISQSHDYFPRDVRCPSFGMLIMFHHLCLTSWMVHFCWMWYNSTYQFQHRCDMWCLSTPPFSVRVQVYAAVGGLCI